MFDFSGKVFAVFMTVELFINDVILSPKIAQKSVKEISGENTYQICIFTDKYIAFIRFTYKQKYIASVPKNICNQSYNIITNMQRK